MNSCSRLHRPYIVIMPLCFLPGLCDGTDFSVKIYKNTPIWGCCIFPLYACCLAKKKATRRHGVPFKPLASVSLYTLFRIWIFFLEKQIMPPFVYDSIRIHFWCTYDTRIFLGINMTRVRRRRHGESVIFLWPMYGGESLRYVQNLAFSVELQRYIVRPFASVPTINIMPIFFIGTIIQRRDP